MLCCQICSSLWSKVLLQNLNKRHNADHRTSSHQVHSGNTMMYSLSNLLCDPDTFFKGLSYVTLRNYPHTQWDPIVSVRAIAKLLDSWGSLNVWSVYVVRVIQTGHTLCDWKRPQWSMLLTHYETRNSSILGLLHTSFEILRCHCEGENTKRRRRGWEEGEPYQAIFFGLDVRRMSYRVS